MCPIAANLSPRPVNLTCATLYETCLNFCILNARSLINKRYELGEFLNAHHFDVVAITEAWLPSDIPANAMRLLAIPKFALDA